MGNQSALASIAVLAAILRGPVVAGDDPFTRGDCNADGNIVGGAACDLSDPIFLLNHLFLGGRAPPCLEACDINADGGADISDAVHSLAYCFLGGPPPAAPFPGCGFDPSPSLGCASFRPCTRCPAQDARGVGDCEMIIGIFWDGLRCRYHSGCSCSGTECSSGYESLESCYRDHSGCLSVCEPMDVRGVGPCDALLGAYWDGRRCVELSGCSCEGEDCDLIFLGLEECEATVIACPPPCAVPDARGVGPCDAILGWAWDGEACSPISGCECEGDDCDLLWPSAEECEAAAEDCR